MRRIKQTVQRALALLGLVILLPAPTVVAVCPDGAQSCSNTYRVDQTIFSSGGELDASSNSYRAKQTAGDLTVGNTKGNLYQAYAGFDTTADPFIELVATPGSTDLGVLSTSTTASTTGEFYVRAWQAGGYAVTLASDPPRNSTYTMTTSSTPQPPAPGTEQFGVNLIRNTDFCGAGCHLGKDPEQIPDGTFSFGEIINSYNVAGQFKYVKGEIAARSTQSTSVTRYTVSYIFNIKSTTAGGTFMYTQDVVATGTY